MWQDIGQSVSGYADWILSAFLVFLFARSRFNTPARFAASTTVWRYRIAAWCYYVSTLITFTLLAFVVDDTPGIIGAVGDGAALPSALAEVSAPVLAALLLTTLMPHFPMLTKVDEWLLNFFRDVGNIPLEVRTWRDRLKKSGLVIDNETRDEIAALVDSDPRLLAIARQDLRFEADGSCQHEYTKVLVLLTRIEQLSAGRSFSRVIEMFGDEFRVMRSKFEEVTIQAARCFALSEGEHHASRGGGAAISPVLECRRNFKEKCDDLYGLMCELVAYAVLHSGRSKADRNAKLAQLGFPVVEEDGRQINPDQIVAVACAIFVIVLGGASLFSGRSGPPHQMLFLAIMISVIYGVAIFCAVLPKAAWPAGDSGGRPVRIYLLSGLAAAVSGMLISIAFKTLMWHNFLLAAEDLRWTWPWSLMSFAFALTIAALCDNASDRDGEAPWLRWAEGAVAGVVLAVTAAFIVNVFQGLAELPGWPQGRPVPELPVVASVSAAIGFVAGSFVPWLYRRSRRTGRDSGAGTLAPAASPSPA